MPGLIRRPRSTHGRFRTYLGHPRTLAATDEYDSNLYLWDIATKSITATLTDPENESLGSVAFGPGGTTLAAIGGSIYLWEIASHTS